jgi:hypothetical protein
VSSGKQGALHERKSAHFTDLLWGSRRLARQMNATGFGTHVRSGTGSESGFEGDYPQTRWKTRLFLFTSGCQQLLLRGSGGFDLFLRRLFDHGFRRFVAHNIFPFLCLLEDPWQKHFTRITCKK